MHKWQVVEFEGVLHFFEYSKRQAEAHAMHIWDASPQIIEHRRNGSHPAALSAWRPVAERDLPGQPCALSETEIARLERCVATQGDLNR